MKIQNSTFKINKFPDFWSRREGAQTHAFEFAPLGIPARISANQPEALAAARLSAGRFSRSETVDAQPVRIQMVVTRHAVGPVPPDLPSQLTYTGVSDWITLSAGAWGHGFARLTGREAVVVLSPELAAATRLVSRYFIDHYLLNFILTEWAMLHASCVLTPDGRHLFALIAPHNTGKSTTALHLLQAGFVFLADGMALLRVRGDRVEVGGYPIGEVKLRDDVLARFPEYTGEAVQVREDRKTVVDLRAAHPDRLAETILTPAAIHLCFTRQSGLARTTLHPLDPAAAWPRLLSNTVYWDEPSRLAHHLRALQEILRIANIYELAIGANPAGIVAAISDFPNHPRTGRHSSHCGRR